MNPKLLHHLKTFCFLMISIAVIDNPLSAQQQEDYIYLVDETSVKCNLLELTNKKIRYKNRSNKVRTYNLEEVLMIFNKTGEYIAYPRNEVTKGVDFINSPKKSSIDLLITLDQKVILAFIISANESEVIYEDAENFKGEQAIGKDVLAAIIFRDGRHELFVSPSQAAEILFIVDFANKIYRDKVYSKPVAGNEISIESEQKLVNTQLASSSVETKIPDTDSELTGTVAPVNNTLADKNPVANNNIESGNIPSASGVGNEPTNTTKGDHHTNDPSDELIVDIELYNKKALQKIEELGTYLSIISDIRTEYPEANKAIHQACELFVDENATVEVSSSNDNIKTKFKIREYFNRLKRLNYDKVEISWTNINYVSNLKKGEDGRYYGTIVLEQTLKGLNEEKVSYSTLTNKNIEVVLKTYKKEVEGDSEELWDILFSGIGLDVSI